MYDKDDPEASHIYDDWLSQIPQSTVYAYDLTGMTQNPFGIPVDKKSQYFYTFNDDKFNTDLANFVMEL